MNLFQSVFRYFTCSSLIFSFFGNKTLNPHQVCDLLTFQRPPLTCQLGQLALTSAWSLCGGPHRKRCPFHVIAQLTAVLLVKWSYMTAKKKVGHPLHKHCMCVSCMSAFFFCQWMSHVWDAANHLCSKKLNHSAERLDFIKSCKGLNCVNVIISVLSFVRFDFAPCQSPYMTLCWWGAAYGGGCCVATCVQSLSIMLCQQGSMCRVRQRWVFGSFTSSIHFFGL